MRKVKTMQAAEDLHAEGGVLEVEDGGVVVQHLPADFQEGEPAVAQLALQAHEETCCTPLPLLALSTGTARKGTSRRKSLCKTIQVALVRFLSLANWYTSKPVNLRHAAG